MFIPNNRIISRLADCKLGGYTDETFENELIEESRGGGKAYDREEDSARRARLESCLSDMVEESNDVIDVNKNDIFSNEMKQEQGGNILRERTNKRQYETNEEQQEQRNKENFIKNHHGIKYRNQDRSLYHRRTPAVYDRYNRENYTPPSNFINYSISPHNLHNNEIIEDNNRLNARPLRLQRQIYPNITDDDYDEGIINENINYNPKQKEYKKINNNQLSTKAAITIITIISLIIIIFVIMFSVMYVNNNKLSLQISTLEGILASKMNPSYVYPQYPQIFQHTQELAKQAAEANYSQVPHNTAPPIGVPTYDNVI